VHLLSLTLRGRVSRPGYTAEPRTVGEHLKSVRLDRGMQQRDAAREIGCDPGTLLNWEKGRVAPDIRFWPAILAFLGYDPRPEPAGFGGRIRAAREAEGLSEEALARRLGLDPGTVVAWERGEVGRAYSRIWRVFERYLRLREAPPEP
jgi:transcriptional regulator with XRE-family HTH domain